MHSSWGIQQGPALTSLWAQEQVKPQEGPFSAGEGLPKARPAACPHPQAPGRGLLSRSKVGGAEWREGQQCCCHRSARCSAPQSLCTPPSRSTDVAMAMTLCAGPHNLAHPSATLLSPAQLQPHCSESRHTPVSEPLCLLFPVPGMLFPDVLKAHFLASLRVPQTLPWEAFSEHSTADHVPTPALTLRFVLLFPPTTM